MSTPASHQSFTNGIFTPLEGAQARVAELSRATGRPVLLVYNCSSFEGAGKAFIEKGGLAAPNFDTALETKALPNPPAAEAQAEMIMQQLKKGRKDPVYVAGFSQGSVITAEAVRRVEECLLQQAKERLKQEFPHWTSQEIEAGARQIAQQELGRIQVLVLGGVAEKEDFPKAVNVTEIYHKSDGAVHCFNPSPQQCIPPGSNVIEVLKKSVEQHTTYTENPKALEAIARWANQDIRTDTMVVLDDYQSGPSSQPRKIQQGQRAE